MSTTPLKKFNFHPNHPKVTRKVTRKPLINITLFHSQFTLISHIHLTNHPSTLGTSTFLRHPLPTYIPLHSISPYSIYVFTTFYSIYETPFFVPTNHLRDTKKEVAIQQPLSTYLTLLHWLLIYNFYLL